MPRKRGERTARNQAGGQRPAACPGGRLAGRRREDTQERGQLRSPTPGARPPAPRRARPVGYRDPGYLPQLHSFPSVVMRRLWAAHDPETTVRTGPRRAPIPVGPPQVLAKVTVSSCGEEGRGSQTPPSAAAGESRLGGPAAPSPRGLRERPRGRCADSRQAPCSR